MKKLIVALVTVAAVGVAVAGCLCFTNSRAFGHSYSR